MGQLVVLAGGAAGAQQIQKEIRRAQREQVCLVVCKLPLGAMCHCINTCASFTWFDLNYVKHVLPHWSQPLRAGTQNALCAEIEQSSRNGAGKGKRNKVAVDAVFFQRIGNILGMCVNHTCFHTHLCCVVEVWYRWSRTAPTLRRLLVPHSCVPEAMSKEAALILFQGVLLVSRTFLTGAPHGPVACT